MAATATTSARPPLCVALDRALLATDTTWEAVVALVREKPLSVLRIPIWALGGKSGLQKHLSDAVTLDPGRLPYRRDVLEFLKQEKAAGREVFLVTDAPSHLALSVAQHLGLFSGVVGARDGQSLDSAGKLSALRSLIGEAGFDYLGANRRDLPLWNEAREAYVIGDNRSLAEEIARQTPVIEAFSRSPDYLRTLARALRTPQWIKNALLFVPLVMAHLFLEVHLWAPLLYAFAAFCLCASATYVINDLLDLSSDRQHPWKRHRPFASGELSIRTGVLLIPLLLAAAFTIAWLLVTPSFTAILLLYFVLTLAYSTHLKQVVILDVLVLAGLYTLRVLAGAVAIGVPASTWLLGFSMFVFISLAFVKRYSELRIMQQENRTLAAGRGYEVEDMELIRSIGPASGYLSVVVLALYINSPTVVQLYNEPGALWLMGPALLYWITRIWLKAHRGLMDDDPIVYAVRDPISYLLGAFVVLTFIFASV